MGEHQATGGSLRVPRWSWNHCPCQWASVESWLCNRSSFLCYVLLLHQPDSCTARSAQELEGDQKVQELCTSCPRSWMRKWPVSIWALLVQSLRPCQRTRPTTLV